MERHLHICLAIKLTISYPSNDFVCPEGKRLEKKWIGEARKE